MSQRAAETSRTRQSGRSRHSPSSSPTLVSDGQPGRAHRPAGRSRSGRAHMRPCTARHAPRDDQALARPVRGRRRPRRARPGDGRCRAGRAGRARTAGPVRAGAARARWPPLPAGQVPDHARRPGSPRPASARRRAPHPARALPPLHEPRRASRAAQRPAGGHEPRRPATPAGRLPRAVLGGAAPAARGAARHHRARPGGGAELPGLGGAPGGRRLVRRPPVVAPRPANPRPHARPGRPPLGHQPRRARDDAPLRRLRSCER